jgi:YrbI family 3-deoxy-D-manno-octulosonate 8-phosphate phosphatase
MWEEAFEMILKDKKDSIELMVFDFDGVMTDNRVILSETGEESVIVNRADGLGVTILKQHGFKMMILSTEKNAVVAARGNKLNISVLQGFDNKAEVLTDYCDKANIDLKNVLYVGNDINDFEAMLKVGIKVAPADAHAKIKQIADVVLLSSGGKGVVRELADLICDA